MFSARESGVSGTPEIVEIDSRIGRLAIFFGSETLWDIVDKNDVETILKLELKSKSSNSLFQRLHRIFTSRSSEAKKTGRMNAVANYKVGVVYF